MFLVSAAYAVAAVPQIGRDPTTCCARVEDGIPAKCYSPNLVYAAFFPRKFSGKDAVIPVVCDF